MAGPYYVDIASGDDGDSGLTEALAFQHLAAAADIIAAGEIVYVKAGVYETEDGANNAVVQLSTAGTITAPIVWQGYFNTINDGGIAILNADPAGDQFNNCIIASSGSIPYNVFKNFEMKGGSSHGANSNGSDNWTFKNCSFHNNGGDGCNVDNYCKFENCIAYSNSADGFDCDVLTMFVACISHTHTAGKGFNCNDGLYYNCLAYDNATGNFVFDRLTGAAPYFILGCTADGNADADPGVDMIFVADTHPIVVVNNIFHDCSVGIDTDQDIDENAIARNNLYNSNTADVTNFLAVSTGTGIGNRGDVEDPGTPFDANYDPNAFAQQKGIDAWFCKQFWADYNEGAGDNPPVE